jgi:hypothetical protein
VKVRNRMIYVYEERENSNCIDPEVYARNEKEWTECVTTGIFCVSSQQLGFN